MEALLGCTLVGQGGATLETADVLKGKVTLLYFSAHWCPPCRATTPLLAEKYKSLKEAGKPFEVVFVSSDKDEKQFSDYFAEMPWLALPFADRARKGALSKKYKVAGIPTLIVVDENGETITTNGRSAVLSESALENFPWVPKTVHELLGDSFVVNKGDGIASVGAAAIAGKHLVLYFSANWCGPCQQLTPTLINVYKAAKQKKLDFEMIFISSCESEATFNEYFKKMPWLALPYSKRNEKEDLSERFGVEGIPHLAVVDPNGKVINDEARSTFASDEDATNFPWPAPAVIDLDADPSKINSNTSLVFLSNGDQAALTAFTEAATAVKASGTDVCFFVSKDANGGITSKIHAMGIPKADGPAMVMMDLGDDGAYYIAPSAATSLENVQAFVTEYEKTERHQLRRS